ncbi:MULTISPECIES: carbohydrate ABC transporter permease [Metabacillus]|jgi:cellobiose transport system permease protein|uniref:Sugar ABC transporter permease n=3 Tax=Metabacillus TaxID=2675233 RepID=A0A179TA49_9BACI|nr:MULTISPECIES: carbohydrate ABC transporter permease [Metabacillus]OAS89303.1 sugar ABC transporter permease [Metabacillus litoralis]QNF28817.1 carbohydrate ABC transporter permease [Metabacillus sp. KUDC1714]
MDGKYAGLKKLVLHFLLLIGVFISIFPFYWLAVMSTNKTSDILRFPPKLIFGSELFTNINNVLQNVDFFKAFLNTVFVSTTSAVAILFFCSLAGFTFAKFQFPGKKLLFTSLLITMMIPSQLSFVPSYIMISKIGWVDTFQALIIPGLANAFGIFWIKQYSEEAIHDSLLDAGRLDGCNHFRLYWNIGLPILRPALAFLGIFSFISIWNDYLWPLVILNDPAKYTLQVTLSQLNGIYDTDYGMVMAGTLLATLPLIILFMFVSRQFISGIAAGAVKD